MVATNPSGLADRLFQKAPPDATHTVVLWTKNPFNILYNDKLRSQLQKYNQLILHLSITGLGGTLLEPKVPKPEKIFSLLPQLSDFFEGSERIIVRFDPVVHMQMPDGSYVCNLAFFDSLAPILSHNDIKQVVTSWVHIYGKVAKRLEKFGIKVIDITKEKQRQEGEWLKERARDYGIQLQGCCVPSWPRSSCIDGQLYNQLHPQGSVTSTKRAAGQRKLCGCTKSLDIGWYHACIHGCVYCYGNPKLYNL